MCLGSVALWSRYARGMWRSAIGAILLVVGACSAGVDAPVAGSPESLCAGNFCLAYPSDWSVVEVGEDHAVFSHPATADGLGASVGQVNMESIVAASGGVWPQRTDAVVEAFWALLEAEGAKLAGLRFRDDGSVASSGALAGGRLWHRLIPIGDGRAVGVEVRAPNDTWAPHADVFLDGLEVASG